MKDFIFVANHSGNILFMNREGVSFDDFSEYKIKPHNLFELFTQKSQELIIEKLRFAKNKKLQFLEPFSVEVVNKNTSIAALLKIKLFYEASGKLNTIAGTLYQVEDEAEHSIYYKSFYLGFIDNLPLGVYRTGSNGAVHYVNRKFIDILGYDSSDEIYKLNIIDIFVEKEMRSKILTDWQENLMQSIELQVYKKNGDVIWVRDSGRAIKDADNKIIFLDGILEDITWKKENELKLIQSEAKLKELNISKDKLFSIISHDLRTPFNQFIGATELLLTKLDEYDKEMIRKFILLLNKEAVLSYRLLENLLQWSKNQRGLITYDPRPVNFSELVTSLVEIYEPIAAEKRVLMEMDIPDQLYIYADKNMLSTILRNLLSNAIKFTPEDGSITITAIEKMDEENILTEYLEVSVSDTGIGINKESIPKLFKFDNDTTSNSEYNDSSTGLGLVLCKDFVEKHNGTIWVESEPGKGSTFYFTIK